MTTLDDLQDLRVRPIPDQAAARISKQSYRTIRIVPGADDLLMPAAAFQLAGRNHYAHADNPPYWRAIEGAIDALWLRPEVGERLQQVDARLRKARLRLFLFDAWRPRAVQACFHDVWMPARLRAHHPTLTNEELTARVRQYWSAPTDDPNTPAPHETGAAIDLTITHIDGSALFMGGVFDDPSALSAQDHYERPAADAISLSHEEARANRRLLYWLMTEAGFAAHPDEWWHYSWGDQMWAALTGAGQAQFGLAAPPVGPKPT